MGGSPSHHRFQYIVLVEFVMKLRGMYSGQPEKEVALENFQKHGTSEIVWGSDMSSKIRQESLKIWCLEMFNEIWLLLSSLALLADTIASLAHLGTRRSYASCSFQSGSTYPWPSSATPAFGSNNSRWCIYDHVALHVPMLCQPLWRLVGDVFLNKWCFSTRTEPAK